MAKIHILTADTGAGTQAQAVVHTATPTGSNPAGVLWSVALKNAGLATSILTVGNGPGQITQAELNDIQAGTLFEVSLMIAVDPTQTLAQVLASVDAQAQRAVDEYTVAMTNRLRYFGATRN
jgi:hypothetical protein